jgi:hypothetical protein
MVSWHVTIPPKTLPGNRVMEMKHATALDVWTKALALGTVLASATPHTIKPATVWVLTRVARELKRTATPLIHLSITK